MPYSAAPITATTWLDAGTVRARFRSSHTGFVHQLYAGRTRIGVTGSAATRQITGGLRPATYPEHLTVIAVAAADRHRDFGRLLAPRPYNRVRLRWTAAGFPADAERFEIRAGTEPGGAVDADNVLGSVPYTGDHDYTFTTEPLPGSGTWNFEIVGVDGRPGGGNVGTPLELSQRVLAHPPDVDLRADGTRLTVTTDAGVLSAAFTA